MNGTEQLSLKDITFLRAIRDINGSPERFASTEQGVTPATVTAITEATTLSEEEVAYRLDHPRLGKSGLVCVYEAGPPGDDSASLNSAELTAAGERAIAEAEENEAAVHTADRTGEADRSEFDDMQEWEPANVENGGAAEGTAAADGAGGGGTATASTTAKPTTPPRTERPSRPTTEPESVATSAEEAGTDAGVDADEDDRLAALEARIEQLEAEQEGTTTADADDELVEEVASLRESTDRLADQLDDALDRLDAIEESEYGALDEKREQQFETAVKSMVAFHQLATEVLDVRVENYEPSAGRADPERVETTRNRIGDALGVGQSGGGGGGDGMTLGGGDDDSNWPDPEEAASGRVFSGDDAEESEAENEEGPELDSEAPDSGVYPPIDGDDDDDSPRETVDDDADEPETDSDAPDSGVYPPIGEDREDAEDEAEEDAIEEAEDDADGSDAPDSSVYPPIGEDRDDEPDGSLPASMQPDEDEETESITETAAEEGHVVDPIRSTDDGDDADEEELPLAFDPETALTTWRATHDAGDAAADPLPLTVDPREAVTIRDTVTGASTGAYARIVDPQPSRDAPTDDD